MGARSAAEHGGHAPLEQEAVEHVDVLIIGAGLSGIGCAYHLQREHPQRTYAILEARERTGGTWDLFRYPGVRSDSDVQTFGYAFRPWGRDTVLADGAEIRDYIRATAREHGIDRNVRTGHRVLSAEWSSAEARWLVEVHRGDIDATIWISADWLFAGTGYYRYDHGYLADLPGLADFQGTVVHPQFWPEGLHYAGKRVLIVGSGATAITLVPAMASTAGHVTMLQRSPAYILSLPTRDPIASLLSRLLGEQRGYAWNRRKNVALQTGVYRLCQRFPRQARALIRWLTRRQLPPGYPVDIDFNPRYRPWDERLCIVPDGDLFRAIRDGSATVVTDTIATFTATGVRLASGRDLDADIVVTATGLELLAFGGIELTVDGEPVATAEKIAFRGMMLDAVPNFVFLIGYTNIAWTLKVDLVCGHFCRLLAHADALGTQICVPQSPHSNMETRPLLDFQAGYVQRALDRLPRQGTTEPWRMAMDVRADQRVLRDGPVTDSHLIFDKTHVHARRAGALDHGTAATGRA